MTKQRLWTRNYILVLLAVVFAAFTHSSFTTIFPLYVLDIGGSNMDTGLMMAALTIAGMITRVFAGRLIDGWGRKKTFVLGSVLFTVNTLAYCFVTNMAGIYFLRFMNGLTQGIYFSPPSTIIADSTPKERLVDAMSYFGIASSVAFAVAPAVCTTVYKALGATAFFALAAVFAAISSLFCFFLKDNYRPQPAAKAERVSPKHFALNLFEVSALLPSLISFFILFGSSSISNFLLPYGETLGIANISLYFTVNNVVIILTRLIMGRLTERISGRRLITAGLVLAVAGTALIAAANNLPLMLLASVLIGVGTTFTGQLIQVEVLSNAEENRRGVASATLALFQDVGTGLGAVVWGGLTSFSYTLVYALSAVTTALGIGVHALNKKK